MSIKRFEPVEEWFSPAWATVFSGMAEKCDGDWVRYEDHSKAISENDAELERLRARVAELEAEKERVRHEGNEWADIATNAVCVIENIRDGRTTFEAAIGQFRSWYARVRAESEPPK